MAVRGSLSAAPVKDPDFTSVGTMRGISNTLGGACAYYTVTTEQSNNVIIYTTSGSSLTWAMIGDAVRGILPSVNENTGFSIPSGGSVSIGNGQSAFFWSPAYSSETTIYAGDWLLDLWAYGSSAGGMMTTTFLITDSSNSITDIVASGSTGTIKSGFPPTGVTTTFFGLQVTVPAGGRLLLILTNEIGGVTSFTIYWGGAQITNLETPILYDYVLSIVNSAGSPYTIDLSASSSPSIDRLTDLTLYITPDNINCIVVTNGDFTQQSSSTITLPAHSTMYIIIDATACSLGSSSLEISLSFSPNSNMHPYSTEIIDLTVN